MSLRRAGAEFTGTFVLVLGGVGAAVSPASRSATSAWRASFNDATPVEPEESAVASKPSARFKTTA